jgi:hypothetical protein
MEISIMAKKAKTPAPNCIINMDAEAYREIGETLQQHACFRMLSLGMSCIRTLETESAIVATIDGYNDFMADAEAADAAADAFYTMGVAEFDADSTKAQQSLSRDDKEKEIGRWKYIRRCTVERGTVHWTTEKPYTVTLAYGFRMEKSAEATAEAYLRSQSIEVESRTGGRVKAEQWFSIKMREGTRDMLSLDKIGRPAVDFVRSMDERDEMPMDWEDQWELIVRKAAKRMASRPGASIDDLVNSLVIVDNAGMVTDS